MILIKDKSVNKDNFIFENSTYYLVECSMGDSNPVFEAVFFSGFVDNENIPNGYNSAICNGDKFAEYSQLHYLKIIKKLVTL